MKIINRKYSAMPTLVKFHNKPAKTFNNLVDDFFATVPSLLRDDFITPDFRSFTPVNIKETENVYVLEVIAPGFQKEDFQINLDNNTLTISVENKTGAENGNEKYILKEYKKQAFKRSFTIDKNIDVENIVAKYLNGVLVLNLPKKAIVQASAKEITIQ